MSEKVRPELSSVASSKIGAYAHAGALSLMTASALICTHLSNLLVSLALNNVYLCTMLESIGPIACMPQFQGETQKLAARLRNLYLYIVLNRSGIMVAAIVKDQMLSLEDSICGESSGVGVLPALLSRSHLPPLSTVAFDLAVA